MAECRRIMRTAQQAERPIGAKNMNVLEIENLCKEYKGFSLKDISFSLPAGYIMGYVGQNGAGKTTTIQLINHICKFSKGTVRINGKTFEENPLQYKEAIAYVGDESYFPYNFRIRHIRSVLKSFYSSFDEKRFNQLIEEFRLPENKPVGQFSRGMKIKMMFAAAFSHDASLLILDEATNGLDPVVKADLMKKIQEYIEDGKRSVFFSTHILEDLEEIADYIVMIEDGEIVFDCTKDDLQEEYVLIKGDYEQLSPQQKSKLIGIEQKKYGFEAVAKSDDAALFDRRFVFEKADIEQIMLHSIRERRSHESR